MARRKRIMDDGDDSDASVNSEDDDFDPREGADARAARNLFENPYQRKRRRVSEDEEDGLEADLQPRKNAPRRSDWTKAPAFVSGDASGSKMDVDEAEEDGEDGASEDGDDDGSDDSDESESRAPSPRVWEEEEDEAEPPPVRGIGSKFVDDTDVSMPMLGASRGGIGSGAKGGIGSGSKGGIGSSRAAPSATFSKAGLGSAFAKSGMAAFSKAADEPPLSSSPSNSASGGIGSKGGIGSRPPPPPSEEEFPSAFSKRSKPSFVRDSSPSTRPATPLTAAERAHFNKIQGSIGARLMAKMGWQAGTGLGAAGEGIVTPVESKLRPQKMGMGFRGFKERTEQSKREEERLTGKIASDDETPGARKARRKEKEAKEKRSDVWKRPKKVKTKVEHKTYEQIVAEAGQDMAASSGIGQIIDATGAVPREVSSLADVSMNSWSPSNDPTRIPEVRHNIRLIAEACKTELNGLAREAKSLDERKKWVTHEDARLRKKVEDEADLIARLQQIQLVASEIDTKSKELASVYEVSLEPFSPLFYKLVDQFSREFERYRLDEIVVAAIAPLVRRMVATWDPLDAPMVFLTTFRSWRRALRVNVAEEKPAVTQVDIYGSKTAMVAPVDIEKPMTPFESLLWNVWLPKVRTSINNDWSPQTPQPAVKLYEAWSSFLPPFIRDNLMDQLILPKVKKAVADWNPKRAAVSLQSIVFPWLPHLGLRMEDVLGDARRKVKSLLRSWSVGDDMPSDLSAWREVFDTAEWDAMLLKYIVPKLGATLRDEFRVNPRDQVMTPLTNVLQWADIIRPSVFAQLLETEFFPKWLDVLHIWLIQPKVSFEEVAQWYSFWKGSFPEKVHNMGGVARGFTRGLQLMNKAIELGPEAPTRLPRVDYRAEQAAYGSGSAPGTPGRNGTPRAPPRPSARTQEITFRSIVEEFAASHNLLFIPTGRAHELSRMPLFRVSLTADGKGGILVYILDDAVWAPVGDDGAYRAISLEDMVLRANT
ncbi:GC-rich sequence DNA-binding factor-like protein-domain-containing protein [Mycena metata]|uniref:GC-rich sequence DNA-binding factor-like protein-domain-containing protein n=1 Tax=Mycena metata TaxID=1033252 RepID=A0AAD7H8S5_9AGAR|nr:GC-rich sequence DNA-binding factor-like protein-domain-containing protein [Mycena metata]